MRTPGEVIRNWGSTAEERADHYGCDDVLADPDVALFRAVSVAAPRALVFGWLCQLRVAPYSYDLLDNFGHRSPVIADPALEELAAGQPVMGAFRLVGFEPGRSITIETSSAMVGRVVVTYRVTTIPDAGCRLVAKIGADLPDGLLGRVIAALGPAGDLLMMRKQLLTLRSLAERDALAER